jgi:hypothetical protein
MFLLYFVNILGIPNMCTATYYTYANMVLCWPDDDCIQSKLVASLHIDNKFDVFWLILILSIHLRLLLIRVL